MEIRRRDHFLRITDHELIYDDRCLVSDIDREPFLYLGHGEADITMYRGNFDMVDDVTERLALMPIDRDLRDGALTLVMGHHGARHAICSLELSQDGGLELRVILLDQAWNRLWLRLDARSDEHIFGCGEQLSYFDLRGHHFPLWTSEPGVGRNKTTLTTFYADSRDHAGGDWWTTNYPEPTFISSKRYLCHADSFVYADFDFRSDRYHELQFWGIPKRIIFKTAPTYRDLLAELTDMLGRQQPLPAWTGDGFIAGVQGGSERVDELIARFRDAQVPLAGVWCQDWEGVRITDFGKRLFWNWAANEQLYPDLKEKIVSWRRAGIRFLGYINPYIANDAPQFPEAESRGYFARHEDGGTYLVDFGGFDCGVIDFTNPAAYDWFKSVIKTNLIGVGLSGWMADFGEYLPTDVVLCDGSDPLERHNEWPALWARCNYEAIHETGLEDEIVYFMRAGASGTQRYCPLLWAGDQSVNWSLDDGLASVIPAALSAGMTGCGLTHSDIGGYTSRYGNIRSRELFMRWAEMAAFTPFMRSHEGNRPDVNFQVYDNPDALNHLARYVHVFRLLASYRAHVMREVSELGLPAQRALFLHYEDDEVAYTLKYEYLFGQDLLVAPVYEEAQTTRRLYLPADEWIHLWSGRRYAEGWHGVDAPVGRIPVFFRADSTFAELFESLKAAVLD